MGARAILHLLLHAAVPALLAWLFWRERFGRAWALLMLGWATCGLVAQAVLYRVVLRRA